MPDGIIRDPKMNPTERRYGILYSPIYGGYLAYDKINQGNSKRFWIGGLKVTYSDVEDLHVPIIFDGTLVTQKVDDGVDLKDVATYPVYKNIFDTINSNSAIFEGINSEVPK